MKIFEVEEESYEKVIHGMDNKSSFNAYIVIHNRNLGPSLGGCRYYNYKNDSNQYDDTLRLAKGMTYKNALADLNLGGGKATINVIPKTEDLWKMLAEMINYLDGAYYTSGDIGITTEDLQTINKYTEYVVYGKRDSGVATAFALYNSILSLIEFLGGIQKIPENKSIAIQGLGKVGLRLLEFCANPPESIDKDLLKYSPNIFVVSDVDEDLVNRVVKKYKDYFDIISVPVKDIHKIECEVFVPCAIGGVINTKTIAELNCKGICGGANNQLRSEQLHLGMLEKHLNKNNIWYVPDYLANSGGVIIIEKITDGYLDLEYDNEKVIDKLKYVYDLTKQVLNQSLDTGEFTLDICNRIAEKRFM